MKFNSQICTSCEQSEKLLSLGLKKETADMRLFEYLDFDVEDNCNYPTREFEAITAEYSKNIIFNNATLIPAWSLHRLLMMITSKRKVMLIRCQADLFDVVIKRIEHEIKEEYFNKEYLEEE